MPSETMFPNKAEEEEEAGREGSRRRHACLSHASPSSPLREESTPCNAAGEPGQLFPTFPLTPAQAFLMENPSWASCAFSTWLEIFSPVSSGFPCAALVQQEKVAREGWGRGGLEGFRKTALSCHLISGGQLCEDPGRNVPGRGQRVPGLRAGRDSMSKQ